MISSKWASQPIWISVGGIIEKQGLPHDQDSELRAFIDQYVNDIDHAHADFIAVKFRRESCSAQSNIALSRVFVIESLAQKYPNCLMIKVMLAECYHFLDHIGGCLKLLRDIQSVIGTSTDPALDHAIQCSQELLDECMDYQDDQDYGSQIINYQRPDVSKIGNVFVNTHQTVKDKWLGLINIKSLQKSAIEEFARFAVLNSVELEGVFELDGSSWSPLIRRGFYENSIMGISYYSKIKKKSKIIEILRNTKECFHLLVPAVGDVKMFDAELISSIHKQLLAADNIVFSKADGCQQNAHYIPIGQYRVSPVEILHRNYEVHFCKPRQVADEMQWFVETAQGLMLDKKMDPFQVSAWIQWAFVFIHPFGDGNGRMARILSSIPLLRAQLPPVVVSVHRKQVYFSHLNDADLSQQVQGLARFLQHEAFEAIHHLESLHNSDDVQMDFQQVSSTINQTEIPGKVVAETIESGSTDRSVSDKSESSLETAVVRGLELNL